MNTLLERQVTADSRDALASRLADEVAGLLRQDIEARDGASLVVSGGSTPKPFFDALSKQALDWSKVDVTLADERWVPASDPDSNETLVRDNLIVNEAASARFVSLYRDELAPAEALNDIQDRLASMSRPFSAVVVGMGDDGHTASLFPDAPELESGMDPNSPAFALMMHPPSVPQARITLTMPRLLDAKRLFLHITGESKRAVLERAHQATDQPLPIVRLATAAGLALTLYWAA